MQQFNIAILGFGLSGSTFHAPLINSLPGFKITHILSSQVLKITQLYPLVKVVSDLDEILGDSTIDLVVNTLPNLEHYTVTKRCLQAGKHVVVEKPFVIDSVDGEELIALAKERGLLLSVYHNRRWDNGFLTLKQILPQLGEIYLYQAYFDRFRPTANLTKWREQDIKGSGLLYDLGSHLIDQALDLFGLPESIYADLAIQRPSAKSIDYFQIELYYPSLRVIIGSSSVMANSRPVVSLYGTNGSYVKHGLDPQEASLRAGLTPLDSDYALEDLSMAGVLSEVIDNSLQNNRIVSLNGAYLEYYQLIYNSLLSGIAAPISAESALWVIKIIEKAILSASLGQRVNLAS